MNLLDLDNLFDLDFHVLLLCQFKHMHHELFMSLYTCPVGAPDPFCFICVYNLADF